MIVKGLKVCYEKCETKIMTIFRTNQYHLIYKYIAKEAAPESAASLELFVTNGRMGLFCCFY